VEPRTPPPARTAISTRDNPYVQTRFSSRCHERRSGPCRRPRLTPTIRTGNATGISEYDWIPYANIVHNGSGVPTGWTPGGAARIANNTYIMLRTPIGTRRAAGRHTGLSILVTRKQIIGAGFGSIAEYDYGGYPRRYVTQERHWDSALGAATQPLSASNADVSLYEHDLYGNLMHSHNSRGSQMGYQTDYLYDGNHVCVTDVNVASQRHWTYACDFNTIFDVQRDR